MQSGIFKHVVLAALIAVGLYAVSFWAIEHRRTRLGPWELTFASGEGGNPTLLVNQLRSGVSNVRLVFTDHAADTNLARQVLAFRQPREGSFELPFGRCIYMDLTFLPGVVTCDFFGHEVEFMPRTLVVDKREIAWKSNDVVRISGGTAGKTFNLQPSTFNAQ